MILCRRSPEKRAAGRMNDSFAQSAVHSFPLNLLTRKPLPGHNFLNWSNNYAALSSGTSDSSVTPQASKQAVRRRNLRYYESSDTKDNQ